MTAILIFSLVACSNNIENSYDDQNSPVPEQSNDVDNSVAESKPELGIDDSNAPISETEQQEKEENSTIIDTSVNEEDYNEASSDELKSTDVEAAKQAALDYYKGTVFEIQSITQIDMSNGWEGEILFQVSCTKGGTPQEARCIALSYENGSWVVVNEGY